MKRMIKMAVVVVVEFFDFNESLAWISMIAPRGMLLYGCQFGIQYHMHLLCDIDARSKIHFQKQTNSKE